MIYIIIFFICFLLSLFFSPLTIKISNNFNIFSKPKEQELKGKPCIGGLGIYAAFILGCIIIGLLYPGYKHALTGLLIPSGIIVLLGLADDAKDLRPGVKIIVELLSITVLIFFGISTMVSFVPAWCNILITFVWILFITNAFNLLDIVDGLTSGLVIIISLTLFVIAFVNKDIFSAIILTAMIGSHLGFLRYNYPPARLYMGDTGSLFSGFILAVIAINIKYAPIERPVALITPILAMGLAIYDTLFLIMMRVRKNKPIFSRSNDHFALRLVTMGYSVRNGLWIMYGFSIFLAIASIILAFASNIAGIIVLTIVMIVFILAGKKVGMVSV